MIYHSPVTLETVPVFNPSEKAWGYMIHGFRTKGQFRDFLAHLRGIHPTVLWRGGATDSVWTGTSLAMGWFPTESQDVLSVGGYDSATSNLRWMPAVGHSPMLVLTPELFLERALIKNLNND